MDPPKVPDASLEQDWDADDFEIPTLKLERQHSSDEANKVKNDIARKDKVEAGAIYLGPHGAPPSQLKQQELNTTSAKKNKRKQKLKEADKNTSSLGRENKVDSIRDIMGGKANYQSPRGNQSGWLDRHCHENMFERTS